MNFKEIFLLVLLLFFIINNTHKTFVDNSYRTVIITECSYDGQYIFPEKIESLNISFKEEELFIFAEGDNICKRNISTLAKSFIIVTKIDNKKYISSNIKLECKNKTIYNIPVECCEDKDCLNNAKCINYVCEYNVSGQEKYIYIYPIFYYNPRIQKCKGSELNYNELIGEDVGELCYTIEKKEINPLEAKNCIWVDGIRNINLYGNGSYEFVLRDYYNVTKIILRGSIENIRTEVVNDDSIRYLCLYNLTGNLNKIEVTTFRYKIFQKKEE